MRNWAPFIAPDESYLIFCSTRGLPDYDEGDLFISFRQPGGSWTDPVTMGEPINTNQMERFSALSPDGKYLFFTRWTPDYDEDVYWVSASIIDKLKAKAIK
jgi:Tol biopolymer transport system component